MNTQLFFQKWQVLEPHNQNRVIAFMDALRHEQYSYKPKTDFGKKLWQLRSKVLNDHNIQLLDLQGIELELDELRNRA